MSKRWLVDINRRSVRPAEGPGSGTGLYEREPGEVLLNAPTAREAAEAGHRRALAAEALFVAQNMNDAITRARFVVADDAIHAQASRPSDAREACLELVRTLGSIPRGSGCTYECWIEADCRVLVLARVP